MMGRGGSARRAALPTVVQQLGVATNPIYLQRYFEPPYFEEGVELTTEADRFVLVTKSMNAGVAFRRAQCHALLADATAAALYLFRSTDTLARLVDLGAPEDTRGPLLVPLRVRLRLPRTPSVQRLPEEWSEQLRHLAAREHVWPSPGGVQPEGPWALITQGFAGQKHLERFAIVTDAGERLRSLLSTHEAFVGLWDLAGDDQPVRVDFGLQAMVDNGPAPLIWNT